MLSRQSTEGKQIIMTPIRTAICAFIGMTALCSGLPALAQEANTLHIEADEVLEWNQTDGTYFAKGTALARQGTTKISAEELLASYDPASTTRRIQRIVATGNVSYVAEDASATGAKLVYDLSKTTYLVEGENARITGPSGTMSATKDINYDASDSARKIIIARGNAVYTDNDQRVIAGDKVIGIMAEDGALQTLDAENNVKVVTIDGQTATGDTVTYDYATSKAVLTGNVEIIDGPNVMRGGRAEVDFDSGISRILSDGSSGRVSGVLGQ